MLRKSKVHLLNWPYTHLIVRQ